MYNTSITQFAIIVNQLKQFDMARNHILIKHNKNQRLLIKSII